MSSDEGTGQRQRPGEQVSGVAAAAAVASSAPIRTKPKRPLSGYNFFFHYERQRILAQTPTRKEGKPRRSHGKIGFAALGKLKKKEIRRGRSMKKGDIPYHLRRVLQLTHTGVFTYL